MKEVKILRHLSTEEDDSLSSLYSHSSWCAKCAYCWAFTYFKRGMVCSIHASALDQESEGTPHVGDEFSS